LALPVPVTFRRLSPQTGTAFTMQPGEYLEIVDPTGAQVADVTAFASDDRGERFSAGRTLDYNETLTPTTGHLLYSNRSRPLLRIMHDDVGCHDVLLAPCSERMFELLRGVSKHPSCHGNLTHALEPFGINADDIDATFNAFMNVAVTPGRRIEISAPPSRAGDRIVFRAEREIIVGITACSSEHTNGGVCKPIDYRVAAGAIEDATV